MFNHTVILKIEPPHGREGHQSQPDTSHDTKKCTCCLKNHHRISIQHLCLSELHLEYASIVWSPWQSYLEDALEKVQCQAA